MSQEVIDNIIKTCELKQKLWQNSAMQEKERENSTEKLIEAEYKSRGTFCPICKLEMCEEGNKPITISPCGHTVCSSCLKKDETFCPICKTRISQRAINYSLMQIADTFKENGNMIPDYKKELENVQDQITGLFDKLEENELKKKEAQEQERVASALIEHLEKELHNVNIKSNILKEKLDEATDERQKAEEEYNGLKEVVENLKLAAKKHELEEIIKG